MDNPEKQGGELQKLKRVLSALRHSSAAMMHATSESDYLDEVCRIITQDCGHAMVWIGYAEEDEGKSVRPVAHSGFDEGYLETLKVTWGDTVRGRGPTGTAIRTGKPCQCGNMLTDPRFEPWRDEALKRGYASSVVLPLLSKGKSFGAVTIYSRLPDAFSPEGVDLLNELAVDLAYGIDAIRLRAAHAETERLLMDLNGELETRVALRTEQLQAASLYSRGLLEASLDALVTIGLTGLVTDVNHASELITGVPRERLIGSNFSESFTEPEKAEAGFRKVLAEGSVRDYPLAIRHISGRITPVLYNATVYRNPAGQVQGVFAAARDMTELKAAQDRREVTHALVELFAHKASGKEYFESVVEVLRSWIGCECLGIRVLGPQGDIPYHASSGFDGDFLHLENRLSIKTHQCFCIRAISQAIEEQERRLLTPGGSLRCDNTSAFMRGLSADMRPRYRGTCVKWGFASLAVIPIRYRDQILGAIHLADRRPDRFSPGTVEFLESMAPVIGEAIQRFHAEEARQSLLRRLAEAQENERGRIARELHDQLGQELTALKLGLRLLKDQRPASTSFREPLGRLEQLTDRLMREIHRLAWELHPAALDDLGLEAALRRYTIEWSEHSGIPVDFHCPGNETGRLPLDLETALYRVTQEALTNVLKHTKAKRVGVLLERRRGHVSLIVEDDGAGFDPSAAFQAGGTRGRLGLLGMKERVTLAGGTIEIESSGGAGTTVIVRVPVRDGAAESTPHP
jgi:PAS domain S-box-containing protein